MQERLKGKSAEVAFRCCYYLTNILDPGGESL